MIVGQGKSLMITVLATCGLLVIALFFLINGGGAFSLDRVFGFDF